MGMPPAHDQRQQGKIEFVVALLSFLEQNGVNVAFEMVNGDKRLFDREGERFSVTQSHEQRSRETRALCNGDGVDGVIGLACIFERLAHYRDNGAQVLARGQLRHDAAVRLMGLDLRVDDARDEFLSGPNYRRSGFVAGTLDAENVNMTHNTILASVIDCLDSENQGMFR